jgi:WD40 repeat protein
VTTGRGDVTFVDLRTGRPLGPPRLAHVGAILSLAFSADGRWLATSGADRAVYLWDARRQRPVKLYSAPAGRDFAPPTALSVSPDGKRLAVAVAHSDGTGELDVLSVPDLARVAHVPLPPGRQTQFSHDGRLLFYGDAAGRVWTIDTRAWRPRGLPLGGAPASGPFALTPDDRILATTSGDGTTGLWDVASGHRIAGPLTGVAGAPLTAAFLESGTRLATLHADGRGYLWDLRPQTWKRRACALAGRALTRAEWHDVLPQRRYAPACAGR